MQDTIFVILGLSRMWYDSDKLPAYMNLPI